MMGAQHGASFVEVFGSYIDGDNQSDDKHESRNDEKCEAKS